MNRGYPMWFLASATVAGQASKVALWFREEGAADRGGKLWLLQVEFRSGGREAISFHHSRRLTCLISCRNSLKEVVRYSARFTPSQLALQGSKGGLSTLRGSKKPVRPSFFSLAVAQAPNGVGWLKTQRKRWHPSDFRLAQSLVRTVGNFQINPVIGRCFCKPEEP